MADLDLPEDLHYTAEHEWVRPLDPASGAGVVRLGITDYAQEQLGDIVFVSLPEVGERVEAGTSCGELESTKSVSDLYAPLSGVVATRNDALESNPELVNADPYGQGWVLEVSVDDPGALASLLDADGYAALIS